MILVQCKIIIRKVKIIILQDQYIMGFSADAELCT